MRDGTKRWEDIETKETDSKKLLNKRIQSFSFANLSKLN